MPVVFVCVYSILFRLQILIVVVVVVDVVVLSFPRAVVPSGTWNPIEVLP